MIGVRPPKGCYRLRFLVQNEGKVKEKLTEAWISSGEAVRGTDVEVRRRVVAELAEEGHRGASLASGLHGWMRGSAVKVFQGSGWSGDSPVSRNCMADGKLTGVGIGDSGRCRGWG